MKTLTRRWFVGVGAALTVAGCLSPTLPPLPPPAEPEMHYVAPGQLSLKGTVSVNRDTVVSTTVTALNGHTGALAGHVVYDGHYEFVLGAEPGDEIELWFEQGADESESLFLTAPDYEWGDAGAEAGVADSGVDFSGGDAASASDQTANDADASSEELVDDLDAGIGNAP